MRLIEIMEGAAAWRAPQYMGKMWRRASRYSGIKPMKACQRRERGRLAVRQRAGAFRAGFIWVTLVAGVSFSAVRATAGEDQYTLARAAHPELFQAYYDEGLMEYCGLLSRESALGFVLRRDDLLAAAPLTEAEHRDVRIAASIAIDFEYQDHGLSGQRLWCKTAGLDAYNRFVARFRARASRGEH